MKRLDFTLTVPATRVQFERELMQVVAHHVMSRTEVNGSAVRREQQLVEQSPSVDDAWRIVSTRTGQRVPVTVGLVGWPKRITSLLVGTASQPASQPVAPPAAPALMARSVSIGPTTAPPPPSPPRAEVDFGAQFGYSIGTHAFPENGYYEHEHFPWRWRIEGDVQVRFNPTATRRVDLRADRSGRIRISGFQRLADAQIAEDLKATFEIETPMLDTRDFEGNAAEVTIAALTRPFRRRLLAKIPVGDSGQIEGFCDNIDGFTFGLRAAVQPTLAEFPVLERFLLDQNGRPYEGDARWRLRITIEVRPTPQGWRLIFEWVRRGIAAAARAAQQAAGAARDAVVRGANLAVRAGRGAVTLAEAARIACIAWYGEAAASGLLAAMGFVAATAALVGGFAIYALFMIDEANRDGAIRYHLAEYASAFVRTIRGEMVGVEPDHKGRHAGIRDANRLIESVGRERATRLLQEIYGESSAQIQRIYNEIDTTRRAPRILTENQ